MEKEKEDMINKIIDKIIETPKENSEELFTLCCDLYNTVHDTNNEYVNVCVKHKGWNDVYYKCGEIIFSDRFAQYRKQKRENEKAAKVP